MKTGAYGVSRRAFLKSGAAIGAATAAGGVASPLLAAGAGDLPDPQSVLDRISVKQYVRKDYQDLYHMSGEPLWDPALDWIRNVDWEEIRSEQAGKTVRFAIGAADQESAAEGLEPFEQLSGIKVELVPIPDDSFYDKAIAEFISGNASFDALQFFSPWLGDFAAPGFLARLDDYAEKWKLPLEDFYDTYRLNYGHFGDKGLYGIPFDCDIQMVHLRKSLVEQVTGGPIDLSNTVPTYDELVRLSKELNGIQPGVAGVGLMAARGFWSTYTWEHIAAQAGLELFDADFNPTLTSDAGQKGMEIMLALAKNAIEGASGAGWGENRAAWLGGQLAMNVSWQDSGTQATRPDQSQIVGDCVTIYEPRIAGGRFAPPNIAGSTSCVASTSKNPEGAFLMLAFLTTSSIMAMNEANANGVAPGYRSVLTNPRLREVSEPAKVWADSLDFAWCAPRIPGMFEMEQALGNEINKAVVGQISGQEALENGQAAWRKIMEKNGFFSKRQPVEYAAYADSLYMGTDKVLPF
ncbi:MAG: extracellular solute-binding protein [Rhodobacteraceae bacterium]|nr:extracellular solute-binding protein [Paracoccaceae bacterium]